MYNKELMSPKTRDLFDKIVSALKGIRTEHKKLINKARKKTITPEEKKKLTELIKLHNKLEKLQKQIWDSHSLVKLVLKNQK